jgi:hypothetical protein
MYDPGVGIQHVQSATAIHQPVPSVPRPRLDDSSAKVVYIEFIRKDSSIRFKDGSKDIAGLERAFV